MDDIDALFLSRFCSAHDEILGEMEMAPAGRRLRILVVDDSALARRWFETLLTTHDVRFARNGHEALGLLSLDLDVVISDLQMPLVSGGELLQLVRENLPLVARMLCTASDPEAAAAALAAGIATMVVSKGDAAALLAELANI